VVRPEPLGNLCFPQRKDAQKTASHGSLYNPRWEELPNIMKRKPAFAIIAAIFLCPFAGHAQTASEPQAAETPHNQVITMTNVLANLDKAVDAKKSKADDPITAKTTAATQLNDGTRVPVGSILEGRIDSVTPSEKKSDSTMVVTFNKLQIKDGKELPVKATLIAITTTASDDNDKPYDPSSYRAGSQGDNKANGSNSPSTGPHPIAGLTVTGSPKDAASGTLTQAKKNVRLSSGVQLVVSVAAIPPGAILQ
jgi:hypothetical protein